MGSTQDDGDLTARAVIRNAAVRLFADRGHDAVTVREIVTQAGVSPALVVHHFGSKRRSARRGRRVRRAGVRRDLRGPASRGARRDTRRGAATGSLGEAFARGFPRGSPLPAYLPRLLLTNHPAGAALFGRWYAATRRVLDVMVEMGVARPSEDPTSGRRSSW